MSEADPDYRKMFEDAYRFLVKYTAHQPKDEKYSEQFWKSFVHEGNDLLNRHRHSKLFPELIHAVIGECTRKKRGEADEQ